MVVQIFFICCLTCLTVVVHAVGTIEAIVHLLGVWRRENAKLDSFVLARHILRVVGVLLVLHWFEAGIWALFYLFSGALPDLETATYFSLTSYTTLGYGDVVLPSAWRLLGPFEAAVGILMFGWSTGVMVAAITRIYGNRLRDSDDQQVDARESASVGKV